MLLLYQFTLKNETLYEPLHKNTKRDKIPQKNSNLLVHIVELSTAVVKLDIK